MWESSGSVLLLFLPSLMEWSVSVWALLTHQSLCGAQCLSPMAQPLPITSQQHGNVSWSSQIAYGHYS